MGIPSPTEEEPYGVFHVALSKQPSRDNYYASLEALTPFLRSPLWVDACSGFYISSVDSSLPRLTYFATDSSAAISAIAQIRERSGLVEVKPAAALASVRFTDTYRGSEMRFRRYLCTYAQFGLDLLEWDRLEAQRLFATYRWQVWTADESGRHHLEPTLVGHSPTYQSLREDLRAEFWQDFNYAWGWNHMFVNMILTVDWPVPRAAGRASTNDLRSIVTGAGLGFDVPSDWTPEA